MLKKLKTLRKLWILTSKDPEYLKAIENLNKEEIKEIPEAGNGGAVFIPFMTEEERDEYLREQEPKLGKFYQKIKNLLK